MFIFIHFTMFSFYYIRILHILCTVPPQMMLFENTLRFWTFEPLNCCSSLLDVVSLSNSAITSTFSGSSIVGSNIDRYARHWSNEVRVSVLYGLWSYFIPIHSFASTFIINAARSIFYEKSKNHYYCKCDEREKRKESLFDFCSFIQYVIWDCQKRKLRLQKVQFGQVKSANWILSKTSIKKLKSAACFLKASFSTGGTVTTK